MKKRLLSVITALVCSLSMAYAQTWTAPVAPTVPTSPALALAEESSDVEDGGNYYVLNVDMGQFLTGANDWGTEISISADGTPYMQVTASLQNGYDNAWVLWRTNDAADKFYGSNHDRQNGYNPPAGRNHLFRQGDNGYVDMNDQRGDWFMLTKNNNGYYYIQSSPDENKFENALEEYAGGTEPGMPVKFTCTSDAPNIEWAFIPVEVIQGMEDLQAQLDAYKEQLNEYSTALELYEARLALYNKLNDAAKYGVPYAEASAVYNNADATVEELNDANTALTAQVNHAIVIASIEESSEDNPIEITEYVLANPDFTQGNIDGWTVAKMGVNIGYQDNNTYPMTGTDGVPSLIRFIEAWRNYSEGTLGDGSISQSIAGLPAGRYRLECDAIASWQASDETQVEGVYLYYDNGSFIVHSEESLATLNNIPEHFAFEFDYDGAEAMTIGLMTSNTNANWVAADNFKLFAIGAVQTPATYTALRALYGEATQIYGTIEYAQTSLKETLENALDEANALVSVTAEQEKSDQYKAAYDKLNSALTDIKSSITAYKQLEALVETLTADDQKYADKPGYEDYVNTVEELLDEYVTALEDGTYTTAQIQEAVEAYEPLLKQAVQKKFDEMVASGTPAKEPLDITPLFDGMTYQYSTNTVRYPDLPDTLWQNATEDTSFKTQYGTAEVWNSHVFDIYREIQLPKGKYTITVEGFYREADNVTNYANFIDEYTYGVSYLYAGNVQTPIFNVAGIASDQEITGWGSFVSRDGITLYQPNNQYTAHGVFTSSDYADILLSSVSTVLSEDGTLRFGVKNGEGLQDNQWTVWEDFHIYYNAASSSDYDAEIIALMEQANEAEHGGVIEAINKLENAQQAGNEALDTDDVATKIATIAQLAEAVQYAAKSVELVLDIMDKAITYDDKLNNLPADIVSSNESFVQLLDAINEAIENESYESNQQIEGWIASLEDEFLSYILEWTDLDEATEQNPVDLTMLVANASCAGGKTVGWSYEAEYIAGADGDGCIEFWKSSNFDIHQTLPRLRDGYYVLSVNAFYRSGTSDNEIGVLNATDSIPTNEAYLYAGKDAQKLVQWSDFEKGALLGTLAENQETYAALNGTNYTMADNAVFCAPNSRSAFQTFNDAGRYLNQLTFHYTEGQGAITIGIRKTLTIDTDWAAMTNFKLNYIGTAVPDAVESIAASTKTETDAIFNLAGQRVQKAQKGIYIIGGKKVLVK